MVNIRTFLTVCLLLAAGRLQATVYGTSQLQQMASAMQLDARLGAMPDGMHYRQLAFQGHDLTIVKRNGRVEHIGFALFTPFQRTLTGHQPILDFLERYTLELSIPMKRQKDVPTQMVEDHVDIRQGSLQAVSSVLLNDTTCAFSMENRFGKQMLVKWSRGLQTVCELSFPLDFELLSGMAMQEREQRFLEDLLRTKPEVHGQLPATTDGMKRSIATGHYLLQGEHYYTEQLNANKYYRQDSLGHLQLLYDKRYPLESLSNLMTTASLGEGINVKLTLNRYGLKKEEHSVQLLQLNNYMLAQGCKIFFGLMNFDGQQATCELIYKNEELGYHHVMKACIDTDVITRQQSSITATLTIFQPTSRVMYLFDEQKK